MTEATASTEGATAARGARWMALAMVSVGLSNYGYSLLLTHLLDVTAYSVFAAGQSLILWALNVATVSVPLILALAIVRSTSEDERNSALRFAKLASAGGGLVAAATAGAIVTRFGSPATALTVALSIFVLFLGTTTTGWLQGLQRIRSLSILYIAENVLKNGTGILLVTLAGFGATGALGAFGIGALAMLLRWPRTPRPRAGTWWATLANRRLWRLTAAMGSGQGLVSLFVAIDVVLVAILPVDRALAASYQVSATLSRIPLYIAGSVGVAFFPSVARRAPDRTPIAAQALRMYAAAALPLAVVLATAPPSVLALVFPNQYGAVATLLKYTAVTGLAAGGISLVTGFFQAAEEYSCQWWLGAGLMAFVAGLLAGWRIDGVTGLAAGGALGATAAAAAMGYLLLRRHGRRAIGRIPLAEPLAAAAVLVVLRPFPWLWLAVACAVGLHATMRFLRPGARHRRELRAAMPRRPRTASKPAVSSDKPAVSARESAVSADKPTISLVIDAAWHGSAPMATAADLKRALSLSRLNRVEGRFALAYPEELGDVVAEVRKAAQLYTRNLIHAINHLECARVPAVLIKDGPQGEHVFPAIELVVSEQHWTSGVEALGAWCEHSSVDRSECAVRAQFYPPTGPILYLHSGFSRFGVPTLPASTLMARAWRNRKGMLVPSAPDYLRICLARVLSQDRALDLSVLLAVRRRMQPEITEAARREASREGWLESFDHALAAARCVIGDLDHELPVSLPVPLSGRTAMKRNIPLNVSKRPPREDRTLGPHPWQDELTRQSSPREAGDFPTSAYIPEHLEHELDLAEIPRRWQHG